MAQTIPQRHWRSVPKWCWWLAIIALLLQSVWHTHVNSKPAPALWHSPATDAALLQAFSLGDRVGSAHLLSLWLQGFDVHEGDFMRMSERDYARLTQWMTQVLRLDPRNQYLLLLASRVYSQTSQKQQQLHMLEFVYQQFFLDPSNRWRWLAETTIQARHHLKNQALALRYGKALSEYVPQVPTHTALIYLFLLDDADQPEQVRQLFTTWKDAGYLSAEDIQLLHNRLRALRSEGL